MKPLITIKELKRIIADLPDDMVVLDRHYSDLIPATRCQITTPADYYYDTQREFPSGYIEFYS